MGQGTESIGVAGTAGRLLDGRPLRNVVNTVEFY